MALVASLKVSLGGASMKGTHSDGGVLVTHFEHSVESERNPINNKATAARKHSSFKIRKPVDLTSPHFHRALNDKVELSQVQLLLYRVASGGVATGDQYAVVTLNKAVVQEIETVMPDLTLAENTQVHEYEDVSFAYDEIKWFVKGSTPTTDTPEFFPDWVEEQARTWTLKGLAAAAAAVLKGKK